MAVAARTGNCYLIGHVLWPLTCCASCALLATPPLQLDVVLNFVTGVYDDTEQRVDYHLRRIA